MPTEISRQINPTDVHVKSADDQIVACVLPNGKVALLCKGFLWREVVWARPDEEVYSDTKGNRYEKAITQETR